MSGSGFERAVSGSSGVPARQPMYGDPGDFVGPIRPGEKPPAPESFAKRLFRHYAHQLGTGIGKVNAGVKAVKNTVGDVVSSVGSSLKVGALMVVTLVLISVFAFLFLSNLARRASGG